MGLSLGGIIAGGMEGGAKAVQGMAQSYIDTENRSTLMQQQQEADLAKAKAIQDYKVQSENTQRQTMANDINSRAGIIEKQTQADRLNTWGSKHQAAVGPNPSTDLTPTDINAADQKLVPLSATDKAAARRLAAAQGGYLDPRDEAAADARSAALEASNTRLQDKLDSNERIARDRIESSERNVDAKIDAAIAKTGANGSKADRLTTIVNSANATLKNLTESDRPKTPEGKAAWQRQVDDAIALRDTAMARLRRGMSDEGGAAAPSGAVKPSSGNSRTDVSNALKLWNGQN